MEVKRVLQLVVVLLLAALNGARAAVVKKYFIEGGNMKLDPKVATTIDNILWKHNGNLLAEWVTGVEGLIYYGTFKGRTALNITTGELEITTMTKDDAGVYTLEINNKVQGESYNAAVIKEVPEPSVWIQPVACTRESADCTMSCEGATTEAEPVTYSWRRDEGVWSKSQKVLPFNKDTSTTKSFFCRMENPVSMKESKPRDNPFYEEPPPPPPSPVVAIVVGVLISLVVVGAVVGVGVYKRDAIKAKFRSSTANNNPNTNGNPPADNNTTSTENVPLKDGERTTPSV